MRKRALADEPADTVLCARVGCVHTTNAERGVRADDYFCVWTGLYCCASCLYTTLYQRYGPCTALDEAQKLLTQRCGHEPALLLETVAAATAAAVQHDDGMLEG